MAASTRIEPSDFVMPTGLAVVLVKIDREASRHLAPSMNPPFRKPIALQPF